MRTTNWSAATKKETTKQPTKQPTRRRRLEVYESPRGVTSSSVVVTNQPIAEVLAFTLHVLIVFYSLWPVGFQVLDIWKAPSHEQCHIAVGFPIQWQGFLSTRTRLCPTLLEHGIDMRKFGK